MAEELVPDASGLQIGAPTVSTTAPVTPTPAPEPPAPQFVTKADLDAALAKMETNYGSLVRQMATAQAPQQPGAVGGTPSNDDLESMSRAQYGEWLVGQIVPGVSEFVSNKMGPIEQRVGEVSYSNQIRETAGLVPDLSEYKEDIERLRQQHAGSNLTVSDYYAMAKMQRHVANAGQEPPAVRHEPQQQGGSYVPTGSQQLGEGDRTGGSPTNETNAQEGDAVDKAWKGALNELPEDARQLWENLPE